MGVIAPLFEIEKNIIVALPTVLSTNNSNNTTVPFPKPSPSFILQSLPQIHFNGRDRTSFLHETANIGSPPLQLLATSLIQGKYETFTG